MSKRLAQRMIRADLPEYEDLGMPSQDRASKAIAAARKESKEKEILAFGVADSTYYEPPDFIKEIAKQAIDTPQNVYTPHEGYLEVREVVAQKLKEQNGFEVDPVTEVALCAGTQMSIFAAFGAVLDPGDEVLLIDPDYSCLEPPLRFVDAKVVPVPLKYEKGKGYNFVAEELENLISDKTRMLVYSNPGNPNGLVYSRKELQQMADLALEHKVLIFADELYEKCLFDGHKHISIASLSPEVKENTITSIGMSKTESFAGFRIGFATANAMITEAIVKIIRYVAQRASYIGQRAMAAILLGHEDFYKERALDYQKKRDLTVKRCNELPGVEAFKPQGAYYAFPDISGTGMSSLEFGVFIMKNAGVQWAPGTSFGRTGEGHMRICFPQPDEKINTAFDRIERELAKL